MKKQQNIDAYKWVDPGSPDYKLLKLNGKDIICIEGCARVFGCTFYISSGQKCSFIATIAKMKKSMTLGIIDAKYKGSPSFFGQNNIIYYTN